MLVMAKVSEELFTHILNEMHVFHDRRSTRWVELSFATYANKQNNKQQKKPETVTRFLKWNINMTIQSRVLSIRMLTILLYVTM